MATTNLNDSLIAFCANNLVIGDKEQEKDKKKKVKVKVKKRWLKVSH